MAGLPVVTTGSQGKLFVHFVFEWGYCKKRETKKNQKQTKGAKSQHYDSWHMTDDSMNDRNWHTWFAFMVPHEKMWRCPEPVMRINRAMVGRIVTSTCWNSVSIDVRRNNERLCFVPPHHFRNFEPKFANMGWLLACFHGDPAGHIFQFTGSFQQIYIHSSTIGGMCGRKQVVNEVAFIFQRGTSTTCFIVWFFFFFYFAGLSSGIVSDSHSERERHNVFCQSDAMLGNRHTKHIVQVMAAW